MKKYKTLLKNYHLTAVSEPTTIHRAKVNQSNVAAQILRDFWPDDIEYRESIAALFLNRANNTIGIALLSTGGRAGTIIDTAQIAKLSLDVGAHAVIIAHNHPSGNLNPSQADLRLTRKVKDALDLFDIELLDHLILTRVKHLSLRDEGLM